MKNVIIICVALLIILTPLYAKGAKSDSPKDKNTTPTENKEAEISPSPNLEPQLIPIPEDLLVEIKENIEDKKDAKYTDNKYIVSATLDFDIKKLSKMEGLEIYGNFDLYEIQYIGVSIKDASIIPLIKNIEGILGITKDVERTLF